VDGGDDAAHARAPEPEDLVRICRALNDAGARYVLIGGFAVIAHGATRFTKDIDLLVDDDPANVAAVKRALGVLADNAAAEVRDTDIREYAVVRVADEVLIDLMGRACGLTNDARFSPGLGCASTKQRPGDGPGSLAPAVRTRIRL
jgi:hypothetical protein